MLAVGNDELDALPNLGDFILCQNCGERHRVEYGDEVQEDGSKIKSNLLAFYKCGGKTYLVGIRGKDIRRR